MSYFVIHLYDPGSEEVQLYEFDSQEAAQDYVRSQIGDQVYDRCGALEEEELNEVSEWCNEDGERWVFCGPGGYKPENDV